jgi:hypothetical protein
MTTTARLGMPYIVTSQAQKEVIHNTALNRLDMLVRPVVQGMNVNTPPVSPTAGAIYIVGASPTGAFVGQTNKLAYALDGGWQFATPFKWLDVVNEADQTRYLFNGTSWGEFGLIERNSGEFLRVRHWQEDVTVTGASKDTVALIPNRSLVIAVNARVMTAVTGATGFSVGIVGDTARYGSGIAVALDTTNIGMSTNPIAYFANTALRLTASGGSFSGGVVRITVQYLQSRGPWSW